MPAKPRWLTIPLASALLLVLAILLIYKFGNFRQERVVNNFLEELRQGNYQKAYQLWGPAPSYPYADFMKDWGGTQSYYGTIRRYRILDSKSRGNGIVVSVEFDHLKNPVFFWVDLKTNTLAFSPFNELK